MKETIINTDTNAIEPVNLLKRFFTVIKQDARITSAHISLYTSLWKLWQERGNEETKITIFSHHLMPLCKVSSGSTYCKIIRDLHVYG